MKNIITLGSFVLCTCFTTVQADTLLLLHGYFGSSQDWSRAGIIQQLDSAGWSNAGYLELRNNIVQASKSKPHNTRRLYALMLTSEQSIENQAQQLHRYVDYVRRQHVDEQIIFVGHSAGGVVARLYIVEHPSNDLIALITIASPHLGTHKAELAQDFSQILLTWLQPMPGLNKLYHSQGLFFDLIPNRTDNLIGWLNYQEHPPARYFSIVREASDNDSFNNLTAHDYVVPSWSQDMNHVHALRGRNKTYSVKGMHGLNKKDGEVLQQILISLYTI